MAEGAGLLNQYAGDRIVGSNPTLSAKSCMSCVGVEMGRKPKGAVAFVREAGGLRRPALSSLFMASRVVQSVKAAIPASRADDSKQLFACADSA